MSIYRFSDDSPIASITFRYANGRPTTALIEASKTATAEHISTANTALSGKGMSLIPVTVDERDMLQVSGFRSEKALVDALAAQEIVKGAPEITKETSDLPPPPKGKVKEFLTNYSFRIAGGLNLIGDISMHFGGYSKITAKTDKAGLPLSPADRKASVVAGTYDLTGGGLYTLGGLNAAVFGNSKSKAPPLTKRTADFIAHTSNPQAVPLQSQKESGNFLRRNAADVTLGAYTLGAGVFLTQGATEYQSMTKKMLAATGAEAAELAKKRRKSGWLMSYGISSLVFKMLSLFIKEKPRSEQDKPKSNNPIIRAKDWFCEKPLRIFGLGSLITDSLYAGHAYATFMEERGTKSTKGWIFKLVTTIAYFSSDILSAISSKNPLSKPLDADGQRDVIARVAQSIAEKPEEKRDALVLQTVKFLTDQPEMEKSSKKSIAASLKSHIKHLDSNPWAVRSAREPDVQIKR